MQATCANGVVTVPTVTPTPTAGITYVLTPPGPYDGTQNTTVTVTATVAERVRVGDDRCPPWTRVDAATATFTVTLVAATCRPVTPAAPSVVAGGVCRWGGDGADVDDCDPTTGDHLHDGSRRRRMRRGRRWW